ncbi:MAG: single-stranded DNA-binding protein [Desulfohalobiaceae bacterium]|nr:single-stranded DNA-binding protein [Desulfohalobiaceae bacterium]
MAGSYNKVLLVGRIGIDPELKYTQSGTPMTNFTLATDESFNDREGNRQERTEWHRIVVWNRQAETVCQYMSKGRQVLVEGSLQTRKWQDKQGQDRYTTEIRAQRVVFLGGGQPGQSYEKTGEDRGAQGRSQDSASKGEENGSDNLGPLFPSEASAMDDAPF